MKSAHRCSDRKYGGPFWIRNVLNFLLLLLLMMILTSSLVDAQSINDQKKTVAFLFGRVHAKNQSGNPIVVEGPLGTAFFVAYPDQKLGTDQGFVYLVTAKHVLRDTDGSFLPRVDLRMNLIQPTNGSQVVFLKDVPVTDSSGHLSWLYDKTDEATDVAVLPFAPDPAKLDFRFIPVSMFADTDKLQKDRVAEGDNLYFIGLMSQYYGDKANHPVVRRGTLALMTDEPIVTPTGMQHAYIAELASWPGNSGSPVFLNLGGYRGGSMMLGESFQFLGIVSGSFLNKTQGVVVDATTVTAGNALPTGISYIVPAEQVRKILNSNEAEQRRVDEIRSKSK